MKTAPSNITELLPNQVFVFGSNLHGHHIGGAARQANEDFGAVWGTGKGLQGQSYAIPTMNQTLEQIGEHVSDFIGFARRNPQLEFLVTAIGCGIAGFLAVEITPLFAEAKDLENVSLPTDFHKALL